MYGVMGVWRYGSIGVCMDVWILWGIEWMYGSMGVWKYGSSVALFTVADSRRFCPRKSILVGYCKLDHSIIQLQKS